MPSHVSLTSKDEVRVMYLRPPRYMWPLIRHSDNFLLPLAYPTLAAWLTKFFGKRVKQTMVDCCALEMGWASLRQKLIEEKPDVVCIGEKTAYGHEAIKAFELVKELHPECVTIAGGHFFSALPGYSFANCPAIDYLIRYEGEIPLQKLMGHLLDNEPLSEVPNLCYMDGLRMVENPLGDPVQDLRELPRPDYNIAGLNNYPATGVVFPKAITIQRGRGCIDTCKFCSWIALEAKHTRNPDGSVTHGKFYRSKSVEQVVDEIDYLYYEHGRDFFKFADATWNLDAKWLDEFSEQILKKPYKIGWWAYFRLDQFMDQEKKGVAEKYVRAGLKWALCGVERSEGADYDYLKKHNYSRDLTVEAFQLLKRKYPSVYRHGTLITGLRHDTPETIKGLLDLAHEADFDLATTHPFTPYPGTPLFDEALANGWIEEWDFAKFDMLYPIMGTETMSREEVAKATAWLQENFIMKKPFRWAGRMFSPQSIRRRSAFWFSARIGQIAAGDFAKSLVGKGTFQGLSGAANSLRAPNWYDS